MSRKQELLEKSARYKEQIRGDFNRAYVRKTLGEVERKKTLKKWVSEVYVEGLEELTPDRQYVFLSNHQSHLDYIIHIILLGNHFRQFNGKIRTPAFIAGKNLDKKLLRTLNLDFAKFGSIFLDREFISSDHIPREEKYAYSVAFSSVVQEELKQNERDIFIYPEGGRNYEYKRVKEIKPWVFNFLAGMEDLSGISLVPVGIQHTEVYEKIAIEEIKEMRRLKGGLPRLTYLAFDGGVALGGYLYGLARLKTGFSPPNRQVATSFGVPVSLEEICSGANSRAEKARRMIEFAESGMRRQLKSATHLLNLHRPRK